MLKLKLTKAEHTALNAAIQPEYKAEGDGFILDTDVTYEDVTPLKVIVDKEKALRKEATTKQLALEAQVKTLTEEKETLETRAKPAGDLEKSYKDKIAKMETDAKTRETALNGQLRTLLVDNVASSLAGEISTVPELLLPHITKRLTVEEQDGKMITRVLDAEGKASASSVNELKQELLAKKEFAPILKASNATGGGAQSGGGKQQAGGSVDFTKMTEQQKVTLYRENPAEFNRLAAEAKDK